MGEVEERMHKQGFRDSPKKKSKKGKREGKVLAWCG